jgi:hypothetical protein
VSLYATLPKRKIAATWTLHAVNLTKGEFQRVSTTRKLWTMTKASNSLLAGTDEMRKNDIGNGCRFQSLLGWPRCHRGTGRHGEGSVSVRRMRIWKNLLRFGGAVDSTYS